MNPLLLLLAALIFTLLGVLAGTFTGLVPGIHVNNVALLVYVGQATLAWAILCVFGFGGPSHSDIMLMLSSFIVATAVTHTFITFVPSVFLGAPDEDTALSVLPGHRMLLRGHGYEAVFLAAQGCLWGFMASLALLLPFRMLMGSPVNAYEKLRPVMAGVLVLVVTLLIYSERDRLVTTGRVRVRAGEVGGVQLLSEAGGDVNIEAWPSLSAGEEVFVDGKAAKSWRGGFLLVRGAERVVVETADEWEGGIGVWVRVHGIALPETKIATAARQRAWAVLLFVLSGAIGWVMLDTPGFEAANWFPIPAIASRAPSMMLFPLFTGLFGLSTMLFSGASRKSLPEQELEFSRQMTPWREARSVVSGTAAGAAVSWFPGVSGASATVIARYLAGGEVEDEEEHDNDREFLLSVGAANAASTVFTLVALFVILKGRSGAAATVGSLLASELTSWEPLTFVPIAMSLLLFSCIVAATLAFLLTILVARLFARRCGKMRYGVVVKAVIAFLVISVFLLTGLLGLLVAGAATALGLVPPTVGVRRVHLMGCLILPAIILLAF